MKRVKLSRSKLTKKKANKCHGILKAEFIKTVKDEIEERKSLSFEQLSNTIKYSQLI